MPTVKQFQKGGKQEKPLDTGHFKTTTGKVVVWGTPEYREAYDRGEVVTDKGVKSPVTIQGGQLDEVVVQNNYKRGFWEKYKDKIVEENKDAGILGAAVGVPISAVASLPQLAMMEGLTGKMQRPSEAMNIQNPYGAMAVDAVTDPANLIGAGVLTKEKLLANVRTSIAPELRQGLHSNGFLDIFKSKVSPKLERSLKKEIFSKPFAKDLPKEDIARFVDDDIDEMINTEEGKKRLLNMGINPKEAENLWVDTTTIDSEVSSFDPIGNKINISTKNNDSGILKNNKTTAAHEVGHWLQSVYLKKGEGREELSDILGEHINDNINLASKESIPYADAAIKNKNTDTYKTYNELSKKFGNTNLDKELLELYKETPHNRGHFNSAYINPKEYFFKIKNEKAATEPLAFAREFRQNMINSGVIENKYDTITEEAVKSFMKDNANKIPGNFDRISSFSGLEHIKGLTDILNKLPAIAPIAGASYLATQGQPQYKNGGKYTNSEQNFLKDYLTAQTFEKGGQKTDKERQAHAFFTSQGWTPEQSIGIIGNIRRESGFNPEAVGDAGKAFGLVQWHPDRQARAKALYGDSWKSFENQLKFIDWELKNTEKDAGNRLKNSKGVWQAGQVVSDFYERPKIKFVGDETRQTHVADVAMKLKGIKLTPEDNLNYGVTFENSVAPYMNAPQIKETPLATIQIPEVQTQQVSYLDTPQETTNLAAETEAKPSKINPQEEAFMQDLLSQMAEGVGYVEPQKSAVFQDGGQIPISSEGMYAYPNQPVIIPSSRITMKNIPHSILAVTDQGDRQILQPEKEYQLKGNNTLEIPLTKAEENFLKDIYETHKK